MIPFFFNYFLPSFRFFLDPRRIVGVLIFNQKAMESVNHSIPGKVANFPRKARKYK